jgi:sortase A
LAGWLGDDEPGGEPAASLPRSGAHRARGIWIACLLVFLLTSLGVLAWFNLPTVRDAAAALLGQRVEAVGAAVAPASPAPPASDLPAPVVTPTATAPAGTAVATAGPTAASVAPSPTASASPTPTRVLPRPEVPVRLRIPSIGVDAQVIGVGVVGNGVLDAPHQADQVGWFSLGPRPGEVGNALLDGHVDWIDSIAVFYYLNNLVPGDLVVVVDKGGNEHRFLVEWKELFPADDAPLARIVGPTEVQALTLITCGGEFNRASQAYTHRWVVRAVAAPPRRPIGHPALPF